MANTVLLTGISGFLAKHVMLTLLDHGYDVRGTVRGREKAAAVEAVVRKAGFDATRVQCVIADLTSDSGWKEAAGGCGAVIHTASPFPMSSPRDRTAFLPEARDGTLRVLAAAKEAGIARIVITSSVAAIAGGHAAGERTYTEDDWSDLASPTLPAYSYSKTVAEQAAWEEARRAGLKLTAINPGFILGPALDADYGTSAEVIRMMLSGKYPGVPAIAFSVVDIRDVALAHVRALTEPKAEGERIICTSGNMSMIEMARALAQAFPAYRRKLPKFLLPDLVVRLVAFFDKNVAEILPELGRRRNFNSQKARALLGVDFRSPQEAVLAMGRSLIDLKAI
jgi:nucleoside-diphosphate-sugar epimerase